MLLEPPIDDLVNKVGNPYKLAVIVGKRAKDLSESLTSEEIEQTNEVTRAINEVENGILVVDDNEE